MQQHVHTKLLIWPVNWSVISNLAAVMLVNRHNYCSQAKEGIQKPVFTPRAYARVKQSVFLSVVVVISTKIIRSRIIDICKHNQLVDFDEKLIRTCFELLKEA